jgi:hypothetical protein
MVGSLFDTLRRITPAFVALAVSVSLPNKSHAWDIELERPTPISAMQYPILPSLRHPPGGASIKLAADLSRRN